MLLYFLVASCKESSVGSQGLLKLFQIRYQTAAFIYKTQKSRSFFVGLFLEYSRILQSSHFYPDHLLLARPLRRSCLQGKKFSVWEEEEFRTIYHIQQSNFANVFIFFLFQLKRELQILPTQPSRLRFEIRLFSLPSFDYTK